ncbi:MAG: thiamine diphosphokinase [Desulfobacula sp.]|nr:thiamine diphosphokinase [Desulfobacula sp.]
MKCVIIANGDLAYSENIVKTIKDARMVICADGGAKHLRALNILPHVMIGDFDSITPEDHLFFKTKKIKFLNYPIKKNHTDTDLCVSHALEHKASDITLLGVTGTRLDHTLANILLLKKLAQLKIPARIIDKHNEILVVTDYLELKGRPEELLSIIPVTQTVNGITLTGLEYPLKNADMKMGDTIGISNVFKESIVSISIKKGILVVTRSWDAMGNNFYQRPVKNV